MIYCRFDLITNLSTNCKHEIQAVVISAVPSVGEIINIKGSPYIVHTRGWSVMDPNENGCNMRWKETDIYCYIELMPASWTKE